jgi:glyoxylase-like metal-dependent hydrolase (beta-lactamase superfamily II)
VKQVELVSGIFHLQGGSNVGLVVRDGKGLLIDAGLDEDTARRALRAAGEAGVTLVAVFLTHAHADHFGGAHFLQRRLGVPLYAPPLEAALMENPIIEPLYLFGGAAPIGELRSKFTLAQPCKIDHVIPVVATSVAPPAQTTTKVVTTNHPNEPVVATSVAPPAQTTTEVITTNHQYEIGPFQVEAVALPGHAPNQVGVAVGEVLFCADAVFPAETLEKHQITFCVDLDETLATLQRLPELPYAHFAPGHGPAYAAGEEIAQACAANRERLEAVRAQVYATLAEPQETSMIVRQVADHFGLRMTTATAYFLTQATILAALSSLERASKAAIVMEDNRLLWQRTR